MFEASGEKEALYLCINRAVRKLLSLDMPFVANSLRTYPGKALPCASIKPANSTIIDDSKQ